MVLIDGCLCCVFSQASSTYQSLLGTDGYFVWFHQSCLHSLQTWVRLTARMPALQRKMWRKGIMCGMQLHVSIDYWYRVVRNLNQEENDLGSNLWNRRWMGWIAVSDWQTTSRARKYQEGGSSASLWVQVKANDRAEIIGFDCLGNLL